MKFNKIIIVVSILTMLILMGCGNTPAEPGANDVLAQCLSEKGAIMYGTEWCSHCKDQKSKFGSSFQYVNYVDCDKSRAACDSAGVEGYPTWNINGQNYPGAQPLGRLASLAGC